MFENIAPAYLSRRSRFLSTGQVRARGGQVLGQMSFWCIETYQMGESNDPYP